MNIVPDICSIRHSMVCICGLVSQFQLVFYIACMLQLLLLFEVLQERFVICYLLFVICYLLFVICYLLFVICYLLFVICYLLFVIWFIILEQKLGGLIYCPFHVSAICIFSKFFLFFM